jgi:hypothetical protein
LFELFTLFKMKLMKIVEESLREANP